MFHSFKKKLEFLLNVGQQLTLEMYLKKYEQLNKLIALTLSYHLELVKDPLQRRKLGHYCKSTIFEITHQHPEVRRRESGTDVLQTKGT